MEFGVFNGEGSIDIIRQFRSPGYTAHYGFDSFSGFAKISGDDEQSLTLNPTFSSGAYKGVNIETVRQIIQSSVRFDGDVILTAGYFSDSLPKFDKSVLSDFPLLFYVDCDLYSSSVDVFNFIDDIVEDGTWILCDDYWCYRGNPKAGQRRALDEWLATSKRVGVTPYCNFNGYGRAFIAYTK